jgi:uncharacterized protein YbjT (DUF2867 family)
MEENQMILVVGATGFLGSEICRQLRGNRDRTVRGLVRRTSDQSRLAALRDQGVELTEGDLKDPSSLEEACQGANTVISTATATRSRQIGDGIESTDEQGQINLIGAAKKAGVSRFILVSFSGQVGGDDPLTSAKRSAERHLIDSGLVYTILRPSMFMESWLGPQLGFDYPNAKATVYGSGHNRISWISLGDVAAFAVACVDNPAGSNAVLELGGPEALSPLEVVQVFQKLSGRRFQVEAIPEEALKKQFENSADSLQRSFAALMLHYSRGDEIPMVDTLRQFPIRLKSVHDYARECLSQT